MLTFENWFDILNEQLAKNCKVLEIHKKMFFKKLLKKEENSKQVV